jgi:hypothetical protein
MGVPSSENESEYAIALNAFDDGTDQPRSDAATTCGLVDEYVA